MLVSEQGEQIRIADDGGLDDFGEAAAHFNLRQGGQGIKVGIVNADPYEHGERAKLNLGHTIGHGLEAASGYAIRHGEAVAIGLVAEARLAQAVGLAEAGLAEEIADCLRGVGLPTHNLGSKPDAIRAAIGTDKKKAGGKLKFALPKRIGEVVWGVEVEDKLLRPVLETVTHAQ